MLNRVNSEDVCFSIIYLVVFSIVATGYIVPSITFAFDQENNPCQKGARGGLELSDWLKIGSLENVGIVVAVNILTFITVMARYAVRNYIIFFSGILAGLQIIFVIMWAIWGIVLVSTEENYHCVGDGTSLGIMSIIFIPCSFVSVIMFIAILVHGED